MDIPPALQATALTSLARAGARLYQKLFSPPDGNAELAELGRYLRTLTLDSGVELHVQVVAKEFPVPWAMLYAGDAAAGATLSWDGFLGFRHVIEQLPLMNSFAAVSQQIASDRPELAVSTTMNGTIDTTMRIDVVAGQQEFWTVAARNRPRLRLTRRDGRDQLISALSGTGCDEQILYFYCHATAPSLAVPGGLDAASLGLSDATVSLADLSLDASTDVKLAGNPLVFINACESAELSPLFYEVFVPHFMAKQARGVIGTECRTPAVFAAAWGRRFFERLLDGQSVGDAVLELRREFLLEHRNPLGLLYGVHCDGDTSIRPALAETASVQS